MVERENLQRSEWNSQNRSHRVKDARGIVLPNQRARMRSLSEQLAVPRYLLPGAGLQQRPLSMLDACMQARSPQTNMHPCSLPVTCGPLATPNSPSKSPAFCPKFGSISTSTSNSMAQFPRRTPKPRPRSRVLEIVGQTYYCVRGRQQDGPIGPMVLWCDRIMGI